MPRLLFARSPRDVEEERAVRRLARARHAPGDGILRARIVTLSWEGMRGPAIAARLACHPETVRRRLRRFNEHGLDGLGDHPGAGRRPRITEAERPALIALARGNPPGRLVHQPWGDLAAAEETAPGEWGLDTLTEAARAQGIDIHRSQARRIPLAEGVRWRRTRTWATSRDPDFAPKGLRSSTSIRIRHRTPR